MLGFLTHRQNSSFVIAAALLLLFLPAILSGCSGSGQSERDESSETDANAFLAKHEPTFNPSLYNPDIEKVKTQESSLYAAIRLATVYTVAQPETIPGFRIQVMLTQEIDEALAIRDSLANSFQDDIVYIVYDAPTYKIRVGNFQDRSSASPLLKQLIRKGFSDAWIVPDNVLKNPPHRLPDQPIEPRSPLQDRR